MIIVPKGSSISFSLQLTNQHVDLVYYFIRGKNTLVKWLNCMHYIIHEKIPPLGLLSTHCLQIKPWLIEQLHRSNTVSIHNPGFFGYTGCSNRIGYGKIRRPTFSARNKSGLTGRAKGRCTQVHFGRRPFWRKKHQHKKCRS